MENQHDKIVGYRDLSQEEIDLMNEIKLQAEGVGLTIGRMAGFSALDQRWVAIAKTQLQQGFMALVRAVAKPTTF